MLVGIYDGVCIIELIYSNRFSFVLRNECVFFVLCVLKGDLMIGLLIYLKRDVYVMIFMY